MGVLKKEQSERTFTAQDLDTDSDATLVSYGREYHCSSISKERQRRNKRQLRYQYLLRLTAERELRDLTYRHYRKLVEFQRLLNESKDRLKQLITE